MTSCKGVVLPREQGTIAFQGPRGGIDESVMNNGMENVAPGHAIVTREDSCKLILSSFARLSINEIGISGDGSHAVPAAVTRAAASLSSRFTPLVLAGSPVSPVVTGAMYASDMWDRVEVERGPVDPLWRNNALSYAMTRQYTGVNAAMSYGDNEIALRQYQLRVEQAIKLSQGPRVFKACKDVTATYCAVALCDGRAQAVVGQFLDLNRRLPLMRELFYLLEQDVYDRYEVDHSSIGTVVGSGSETSEEGDPVEEVSSALPGHRWIPEWVHGLDSFENIQDEPLSQEEHEFGNGF
jgi:hypothetical protein